MRHGATPYSTSSSRSPDDSSPASYLYVLLDIFSRYVVGWLLARQEAAALAKVLIAESCERQHIAPDQLIIHADRGRR